MNNATPKVEREAALRWIPLSQIHISPAAQRDLNQSRVDRILANLDLEQLGNLTVNERDGAYYCIDGQHRRAALAEFFEADTKVQCWTYFGLSEEEEADRFLKLNDTLQVTAFAKFRVGVTAGRVEETDIDRIVRANGCTVTQEGIDGAIGAVTALRRIYTRTGGDNLGRTIRIVNGAFDGSNLDGIVLEGTGYALDRYGSQIQDERAMRQLGSIKNAAEGLIQRAEVLRRATGQSKTQCVSAAVVDQYNNGLSGGSKLRIPSWWKDQ